MDLKERYDALPQRFFRECMRNDDLHDRIDELTEQNKQLTAQNKQSTQALETLKQAFEKKEVEVILEAENQIPSTEQITMMKGSVFTKNRLHNR